jgi:Ca2+-binding RTX toxin-like protein
MGIGSDVVRGGGGNDEFYTSISITYLSKGNVDSIFGEGGNDVFFELEVEHGTAFIDGGPGDDSVSIYGEADGAAIVSGGDGNDTIQVLGWSEDNKWAGGDGADVFVFHSASSFISEISDFSADDFIDLRAYGADNVNLIQTAHPVLPENSVGYSLLYDTNSGLLSLYFNQSLYSRTLLLDNGVAAALSEDQLLT